MHTLQGSRGEGRVQPPDSLVDEAVLRSAGPETLQSSLWGRTLKRLWDGRVIGLKENSVHSAAVQRSDWHCPDHCWAKTLQVRRGSAWSGTCPLFTLHFSVIPLYRWRLKDYIYIFFSTMENSCTTKILHRLLSSGADHIPFFFPTMKIIYVSFANSDWAKTVPLCPQRRKTKNVSKNFQRRNPQQITGKRHEDTKLP